MQAPSSLSPCWDSWLLSLKTEIGDITRATFHFLLCFFLLVCSTPSRGINTHVVTLLISNDKTALRLFVLFHRILEQRGGPVLRMVAGGNQNSRESFSLHSSPCLLPPGLLIIVHLETAACSACCVWPVNGNHFLLPGWGATHLVEMKGQRAASHLRMMGSVPAVRFLSNS